MLQVSQPTQETGRLPVKSSPASTWLNLTGALAPTGEVCLLPLGASVDNRGAWGCYRQQVPGCTLLHGFALDLRWKQRQTVDQISCSTNPIQFIGRCQSAKTKKILADCGDAQVDWLSRRAKQGRYLSNIYLHLTSTASWSIVGMYWLANRATHERGVVPPQTCMSAPYGSKPLLTTLMQG